MEYITEWAGLTSYAFTKHIYWWINVNQHGIYISQNRNGLALIGFGVEDGVTPETEFLGS